jgi:uncharacterized protein YmfQ (DUF2313 family)
MKSGLPKFYEVSRQMQELMNTEGKEFGDIRNNITEVLDQFFIETATWDLERWEKQLKISVDLSKPISERRSVVKSKIRGVGTVKVSLVKNVAESYDRGEVEVTEQTELYQFTVKFIDTLGAPPNIDDLKTAIEEIKPAHLGVIYEYKYLLVEQIHKVMTISDIQTRPLTDFAPFVPV